MVVTKKNGENPVSGRLFSSFLSLFFFFFLTACCLAVSVGRRKRKGEMKEKEWGKSVNPASLLVFRFSQARQDLSGALLREV